ncbi:tRNA (adenosine(37)-N6)-threonylcarbamoyltransferase complex dimerization subunit type 1 TsaB [Desulfobulbus alkaliphilus]|uniref:tRNA (adenosine(37)-N6)-threonylcarbamoyltransferase complex dimerization subunit type 1 TsaB n=1 Tax=Desulfobulbus alkaliphilus TaxID=869814 RepID=UPI0019649CD2|nr:tRNA (adenosine(37)-N6)-threonylcarbamoyltransferase complex dimerization subunit type 1 TsaB [Desulfobulbus alkaliphilus]MBM9535871.1 tRNA (adenosine(37)-N6)-threonylcarbamoyltransferase complex dimerization subunit type 1 TsaB [Desulfobulbus alkaliphilus]
MVDALILSIETATGCGSVALTRGCIRDGRVLAEYTLQPELTHSRRLLGVIETMMSAARTDWKDLDAVAVSRGPGSFTGLRIGMAAAQGVAMAAAVPLVGVATLDGMAAAGMAVDLQVCWVLDARKQQVYAAFYRYNSDCAPVRISGYLALTPEQLLRSIREPTLLAGPGVRVCQPWCEGIGMIRILPAGPVHPRAALVGFCAAQRLTEGGGDGITDRQPLYVRASEAELNLRISPGPNRNTTHD